MPWLLALLLAAAPAPDATPAPGTAPAPNPVGPLTAAGARAGENAVRQAGDAFGTIVGREAIGIYDEDQVRGFSPIVAGNVRIDGLYFDPVTLPSDRLSGATVIRVGPSAFGSPFPAPTGIVDFTLRKPGDRTAGSVLIGYESFGEPSAELDLALPVTSRLALGIGATAVAKNNRDATQGVIADGTLIARWQPTPTLELVPFVSWEKAFYEEASPVYLPAGKTLPPDLPRRFFQGPSWARYRGDSGNVGAVLSWAPTAGWQVKGGLFRSQFHDSSNFANLFVDVQPDGSARHLVIADPPLVGRSTSGELRLTRRISEGPRHHQLHLALRGRDSFRRFDGSMAIDLGATSITSRQEAPLPPLTFTEQQQDRVRQWTLGLAYEGRWDGVGEVSAGVQRSDYSKRIGLPGGPLVATAARPLFFNVSAAVTPTGWLTLYGGYVTGLEESGVAPDIASNRNEATPAIRTRQWDAGARVTVGPMSLVAGVFDVSKPYFNLDSGGRFRELGQVSHRGVEASLTGDVGGGLSVAAGLMLLDARVDTGGLAVPGVGRRPVGAMRSRLQLSADWQPGFLRGTSFDVQVTRRSAETASVDNLVSIPTRTLVNLGGRYGFHLAGKPATLRVRVVNLFDLRGVELAGAEAYTIIHGRLVAGYVTVDF